MKTLKRSLVLGLILASALATPASAGAAACVRSAGTWANAALTRQTGAFTVEFDATPSLAKMDGVSGLSNGAASSYSALAAAVRFNAAGAIDARNGGGYAAAALIPYSAGLTYHFRLAVDVAAHTYSAYVRQGTGAEQLIGSGYAFRTEQNAVAALDNVGVLASTGAESVCAAAVASADATAPVLSAAACVRSAGTWANAALTRQTGAFTAEFDATPSLAKMDGVSGLSNGASSSYSALAAAVRFNNAGAIDARNGGGYAAAALIPYSAGLTYHFRLAVDVAAHTYSAYVRQGTGAEQLIGSGYAFRTEQNAVAALDNVGVLASTGAESVCAAAVASADATAPSISAVAVSGVGSNGAAVTWTTNEASDTQVEYGPTASYGSFTDLDPLMTTTHTGNLLALTPSTLYHYRVRSRDKAGNLATSGDGTFTTNAAPALPPTTTNSFTDDFSSYPKNTCFADGTSFGPWLAAFGGYGCTKTATDAGGSYLEEAPQASVTPAETHASMVLGPRFSGPINYAITLETVKQLRTGSPANPWEVAWIAWNYTDDVHFYYLALKPNGWELGKEDPAYPGAQRYLATGASPVFPIGARYGVRVVQDASNVIRVYVDDKLLTTFTDTERPYTSGRIAFYNEDAQVRARSVAVNISAPVAVASIGVAANGVPAKAPQKLLSPARADGINDAAVFGAAASEVSVYDISGRAVFHGSQQGGAPIVWNGRDGSGRVVESGVYIAKIREVGAGVVFQSFVVAK